MKRNSNPAPDDATAALRVLEADQVVAVKQRTRFGPRRLSLGLRVLLWALRIYVVLMMAVVVVSIFRAAGGQ